MSSGCICQKKTKWQGGEPYKYPTLTSLDETVPLLKEHGYFVVRGLITAEEIGAITTEISSIVRDWLEKLRQTGREGNDWEEVANRDPAWKSGKWEPEEPELGIRRLYRMTLYSQLFADVARHPKILPIITRVLGPDIKLLQSMSLLKPPGSDQKKWHQDNAYFRLTPCKVLGIWIALDPASCDNGCMHILPSSHGVGFYTHAASEDNHIDYSMVDKPNPDDVVPVILEPGDAMIFHGELAHSTPPNVSTQRRRSLQFHYASSECKLIKCPKTGEEAAAARDGTETVKDPDTSSHASKPHYFDCDPGCQEVKYFYSKKGEILVCGRDHGEEYI